MTRRKKAKGHLVGVGLDQDDDLKRITRADDFTLLGGSEETHDRMTKQAKSFCDALAKKGKKMGDLSKKEFCEIVKKVSKNPKTWFYLGGHR